MAAYILLPPTVSGWQLETSGVFRLRIGKLKACPGLPNLFTRYITFKTVTIFQESDETVFETCTGVNVSVLDINSVQYITQGEKCSCY